MHHSDFDAHKELSLVPLYEAYKPPVTRWEQSTYSTCYGASRDQRKADLAAANKVKGKAGSFLRSADMKALNNLKKMGV